LRTDAAQAGCTAYASGCGVFTSVSGSAPDRIFNIEWRTVLFGSTQLANFEVRLYEGQSRADFVYGLVDDRGSSATVGVQRDNGNVNYKTQFECNTANSLSPGMMLTLAPPPCATPLPTVTATHTPCPITFSDVHPSDYFYNAVR